MITFGQYQNEVAVAKNANPQWRMGQACFNVLYEVAPEIANTFRGSSCDPYYLDSNIPAFLSALYDNWPD